MMSDNKSNDHSEELDFVTKPTFQQSVRKAKRRQTIKFFIIGSLSTLLILYALYLGASYALQKRIINDNDEQILSEIKGANVYRSGDKSFTYGFLNATSQVWIEKTIGDRTIIWNTIKEQIPALGSKKVIDNPRSVESSGFSDKLNRFVHYNSFNGEREVEFYYPHVKYDYLPNELEIATNLDENTLAEVALSFDKPYTLKELEELMGSEDVNWLWVNTEAQVEKQEMDWSDANDTQKELIETTDPRKNIYGNRTMSGASANGFQVKDEGFIQHAQYFLYAIEDLSKEGKYQSEAQEIANGIKKNSFPTVDDIRIIGAVVTGTPEELERFTDLGIMRASTIGATTSLY